MNPTDILIRPVSPSDVEALQEIGKTTFIEAFGTANTPENMQQYLDSKFNLDTLLSEIKNPESRFFFSVHDDRVIGYLKVNFGKAQTESMPDDTIEIERIYVLANYYGKGVAKILFDIAIAMAKEKNATTIWLGVWEENPRAIQFYKKNGFIAFDKHSFTLGDEVQTDVLMKLKLQ